MGRTHPFPPLLSDAPHYLRTVDGLSLRDAQLAERCDLIGASTAEAEYLARKLAAACNRIRAARPRGFVGRRNSGRGGLPTEKVDRIRRLWREGRTPAEISRIAGIDRKTVTRYSLALRARGHDDT